MDGKAAYTSLSRWSKKEGGFRACTFIFVLGTFETMGFVATMASMVLYFKLVMQFDLSTASTTVTNFMGSTCLLTLLGGFISDSYLNRLFTCLIFGSLEILALAIITIQAQFKDLQPDPCGKSSCVRGGMAFMFYCSLYLLAIGAGAAKGALPTLGTEQFDHKDPKGSEHVGSYFNYYMLSTTIGGTVGITVIIWVFLNEGWYWGFLIVTITAFIGYVVLALGKPFYCFQPLRNSPFVRIAQVIVLAIRNRSSSLPENSGELFEINDKDRDPCEEKISYTNQFRCLDKAAILREGMTAQPWKVCTVTQIEEFKVLIRLMPIIASTIIMNTCLAQLQTFSVLQGYQMDPRIGSKKFPTASIPVIPLVFMIILIPIYEFVFVPFARKITGLPSGITQLQRVGVGLVFSIISMSIAGIVEVMRRDRAIKDPTKPISLFWLSFQYGIFGLSDMFTIVGLLEFFNKEAPSGMRSLSTSFTWLSQSFGYFLSSILVNLINSVTAKITPSKKGWLHGDSLNDNNLNLFYWFLAILSTFNFASYLYCSTWYKYKKDATESGIETQAEIGYAEENAQKLAVNH